MNGKPFDTILAVVLLGAVPACGGDSGSVQVFVVPEDSITSGIAAGTEPENIHDGWSVSYDRFLATVGGFYATRSDTGDTVEDDRTFVLDLRNAPTSGYVMSELKGLAAARWDVVGYDISGAREGAVVLPPTTAEDAAFMIRNGYAVYLEGKAKRGAASIGFSWGFSGGTSFDHCESPDGIPGFAVPRGGTVQVKPTIHGDHELFDNVTQGVELTQRLAQWMETCDGNRDSNLTLGELQACDVVWALPSPPYDLTGVTDQDRDGRISVYDFVATQMHTLGDFQGDGECPTRTPIP